MKTFKHTVGWLAVLALLAGLATTAAQEKVSGTYTIYRNGSVVASDKYEVTPGREYSDGIKADTQKITINLKFDGGTLAGYERQINGLPSGAIKLNKTMLSFYEGTGMVGVLSNEEQFPVFEPSAYAEYAMFSGMLYDQSKGGKQTAKVIIPALQDVLLVEIERHGTDDFSLGTAKVTATHYRIAMGKKKETVNLWMDGDRMMAAYLASGNIYIIETRYDQLIDRVKQLVNRAM